MPEEPKSAGGDGQQDQVWKYKDMVDKYSEKPDPQEGGEENRTIVGLNAVKGRSENPFLPVSPPDDEDKKPTAGMDGRFDYMPP